MYKIAVINSENNIGAEIVNYLSHFKFPYSEVIALGEREKIGKEISFGARDILKLSSIDSYNFENTDLVFFACLGEKFAKKYRDQALMLGATVVDMSHFTAFGENVKSLIPCVNQREFLAEYHSNDNLISLPSSIASQLAVILKPLDELYDIKRVVISTYQAVSNEGERQAMDELYSQTKNIYDNRESNFKFFSKKIAFNIIPSVGRTKNGESQEELRIINDLKKLVKKDLKLQVNTAYVPVFIGNSVYLNIEFNNPSNVKEVKEKFYEIDELEVVRDQEQNFDTPYDVVNEDRVFVSRIRKDETVESGISLWTCCDNLRRGSAIVAVEIAQFLEKNHKLRTK